MSRSAPAAGPGAPDVSPADGRQMTGIVYVLVAVACFSGIDGATKSLSAVPVLMVLWCRFVFQAGVTALVLVPRQGSALFSTEHVALHCVRGALMLSTSAFAFLSLRFMPIGEFTAIVMLTPLIMTLVAALAFSEPVSRVRWTLILAAFFGAMLVVKPGTDAFRWSTLLPIVVLVLNTSFHLVTSRLSKVSNAGTMHFYTGAVAAALATFALPFAWVSIDSWTTWLGIGLLCAFSAAGHSALILGYARAGIAALTPLLYLQIVFGTGLGWLVFDHVPDRGSLTGIVIITASGAGCAWLSARRWMRAAPRTRAT